MVGGMSEEKQVTYRIEGHAGFIELNRPRALNSLTPEMVEGISNAIEQWREDDAVQFVVIYSTTDRAYCAGGDVRAVADADAKGDLDSGDEFFRQEYDLNLRLAEYLKPIAALMEGVVMGGGFGISAHGSHRVITPRTLGAMPETAIGFVPDVGMSHVLTHLNVDNALGIFIGCTGWRLSPADLVFTGLGTNVVDDIATLRERLANSELDEALQEFAAELDEDSALEKHQEWITKTFSTGSWVEIEQRINATTPGEDVDAEFLEKIRKSLKNANPTSLVAVVELFRRSAETDLATALRNELALADCLRREENFQEGVRAVLVDKSHDAKFNPASSAQVAAEKYRDLLE